MVKLMILLTDYRLVNVKMLTNVPLGASQSNDFMTTHPTNCQHSQTEYRFVDYHFTLELYALFCTKCNKQLTKPTAV